MWLAGAAMVSVAACSRPETPEPAPEMNNDGSSYLFVWAGDADGADADFLAVLDARGGEATYGDIVATAPVDMKLGQPHHTEYEFPESGMLFADGWLASRTFLFDLKDPKVPKVAATFDGLDGYSYPHSYARLKNGNVLATFQGRDGVYGTPGGLVEIDPAGNAVRSASVLAPGSPEEKAWPYSLAVSPAMPRAIVSMAEMGMPPWEEFERTNKVQIWDTDKLRMVAEIALPEEESGWRHLDPAEPRFTANGTAFVATFSCGLYRIDGVDGDNPHAEFVFGFPGGDKFSNACTVPVIVGHYWIQTVMEINGLIVVDLSDPKAPREAFRLQLDHEKYMMPHWVAADRQSNRIVVTGNDLSWVLVLNINPGTGELTIDESFGDGGRVSFDRADWPHGASGKAVVHGSLFGG